jgi:hypothetical protein
MDRRTFRRLPRPTAASHRVAIGFLAVAFAACTERVHHVQLTLAQSRMGGPAALLCREQTSPGDHDAAALVSRTIGAPSVSVVIDYFAIAGAPGCLPNAIRDFCQDHCCPRLVSSRVCLSIPPPPAGTTGPRALASYIQNGLVGREVTREAPSSTVLVRMVVTTQPCEDFTPDGGPPLATAFNRDQVAGCAISCPQALPSVEGELVLALQGRLFTNECDSADVAACALGIEQATSEACDAGSDR